MRGVIRYTIPALLVGFMAAAPAAAGDLDEILANLDRAGTEVLHVIFEGGGKLLKEGEKLGDQLVKGADDFFAPGGDAEKIGKDLGDGLQTAGREVEKGVRWIAGGFEELINGKRGAPRSPGNSTRVDFPAPTERPRAGERWIRIESISTGDLMEIHVQGEKVRLYFNGIDLDDDVGPETFDARELEVLRAMQAEEIPVRVNVWE